jgi:hypothetical protein
LKYKKPVLINRPTSDTYCIPFFAKPGRHVYTINGKFYICQVTPRVEQIPILVKQKAKKQVHREFVKHNSVFKLWHEESLAKQKESLETDLSLWKVAKFIKGDDNEVSECKRII